MICVFATARTCRLPTPFGRHLGCPPEIIMEIENLQHKIPQLTGNMGTNALPRPTHPNFVHPYPLQTHFTRRVAERKMLTETPPMWQSAYSTTGCCPPSGALATT
jgi:hypothetical protein